MLNGGYSWRLFFYVCLAFAIALFILAFLFVEETSYDRKAALAAEVAHSEQPSLQEKGGSDQIETTVDPAAPRPHESIPLRKSYAQTLSIKGRIDNKVPFFVTMLRSFSYYLVPQALWVITTYGICIGLGGFAIGFTFPLLVMAPPYNWDVVS